MHELSIALGIIDVASEEAERRRGRILAVHLRLGPLSGVVREAMMSAFELAREGTLLDGAKLVIKDEPIVLFCPSCQAEHPAVSIQQMACSKCGTPSSQIVRGRELEVFALEVCDDADNPPR